ncbi:RIP metalloprotease RseP [Steroidobacter agaridevorans]|uniref:RIP metalloprotease RseP n=1 Tax=Steroidobacter agaridevorans TaxID=2695856 RepID=UPI001328EFD4|nr:RIP metalloprotease RseP [Steroidobacter agaridevorans]GFE87847.1 zinc metalloprotease [Steroidobacter agaridevorans]
MITPSNPLEWLIAIVGFIIAIGILVSVHEFGHYWVARRLGIKVLRFSIGFGKPLWKRVGRDQDRVEYVIAAIPLGGYVRLLDEREGDVPEHDLPRAFTRQPVWKRIAVLLAGPLFNLFFAVFLYWILFTAGVPAPRSIVGDVEPNSIAAQAGLRFEDHIVNVGGQPTDTWEEATLGIIDDLTDDGQIHMRVRGVDGSERDLILNAGNRSRELTQPDALMPGLGFDIWRPRVPAVIATVMDDSAAARAGLKVGDEILKVDQLPVADFSELVTRVKPYPGRDVTLEIRRDGQILAVPLTIGESMEAGKLIGRIGVGPENKPIKTGRTFEDMVALQKYGVFAAVGQAATKTWDTSVFTLRIVGRIVTGNVSLKAISGPISIAETAGFAIRQGWRFFLGILALISISLGVLNLLPIPILDGGQIVYQLAELVKGKPVSERALQLGHSIGIAMLILMMTLAFYNDIVRHLN